MPIAKYLNWTMNKIYMALGCPVWRLSHSFSIYSTGHAKFIVFCIISKAVERWQDFQFWTMCSPFVFCFATLTGCRNFSVKNSLINFILFRDYVIVTIHTYTRARAYILCVTARRVRSHCSMIDSESRENKGCRWRRVSAIESNWCWWCEMIIHQSRINALIYSCIEWIYQCWHLFHARSLMTSPNFGAEKALPPARSLCLGLNLKIHHKPILKVRQAIVWHSCTCSALRIYQTFFFQQITIYLMRTINHLFSLAHSRSHSHFVFFFVFVPSFGAIVEVRWYFRKCSVMCSSNMRKSIAAHPYKVCNYSKYQLISMTFSPNVRLSMLLLLLLMRLLHQMQYVMRKRKKK